jgi:polysaccharide export outer membrane protein
MTPLALKEQLALDFKKYVTAPEVSVVIKEINSRKVFVTGEVKTPGAYDLQPRAKLMQILSMAGGLTPYARGKVIVLRDNRESKDKGGGNPDVRFEIDLKSIISGKRPQDNIILQPGDTLVFP